MKTLLTAHQVKQIFLFYGATLTDDEIAEETDFVNTRTMLEDEVKSATEIAHQYAEQRAGLDFGDLV